MACSVCSLLQTVLPFFLAFSFLTMQTSARPRGRNPLRLRPSDVRAVVNEPFQVTCSVKSFSLTANSSMLEFCIMHSNSPDMMAVDTVHILNHSSAKLQYTLHTQTRMANRTAVICFLKNSSSMNCSPRNPWKVSYVLVGYRPFSPVLVEHFVDNWEQLYVQWHVQYNPVYNTTYTVWFWNRDLHDFERCLSDTPKVCILDSPFTRVGDDGILTVRINGSNPVGQKSAEFLLHLHEIVRPGPVHELDVFSNASAVYVTFNSPKVGKTLKYNVTADCAEDGSRKLIHVDNKSAVMVEMHNVPAYSNCIVSVSSKPSHTRGYWSQLTMSERFQTLQRVPDAAPEICACCFELLHSNASRMVTLHFKSLAKAHARGKVVTYRVNITCPAYSDEREIPAGNKTTSLQLDLPINSSCVIRLDAGTERGFNDSLHLASVAVPSHYNEPEHVQNFTAIIVSESHVQLFWIDDGREKQYTVFWRRRSKEIIQWELVPSNLSQHDIVLPPGEDSDHYRFGIALLSHEGWSSGISWSSCVYRANSTIRPTQIHHVVNNSSSAVIHLEHRSCVRNAAYVYAYRVNCCTGHSCIVKVVSSSESTIPIGGLAAGNHYQVHVESISLSGVANSKLVSFETQSAEPGDWKMLILLAVPCLIIALIAAALIFFYRNRLKKCYHNCYNTKIIVPSAAAGFPNDKYADRRHIVYGNPVYYDAVDNRQVRNNGVPVIHVNRTFVPNPDPPDESEVSLLDYRSDRANDDSSSAAAAAVTVVFSSGTDRPQTTSVPLNPSSSADHRSTSSDAVAAAEDVSIECSNCSTSQSDVDVSSCPLSPDSSTDYFRAAENVTDGSGMYRKCGSHTKPFTAIHFNSPPASLIPCDGDDEPRNDVDSSLGNSNNQEEDQLQKDDLYCCAAGRNPSAPCDGSGGSELPGSSDYSATAQAALDSASSNPEYARASITEKRFPAELYGCAAPLSQEYDVSDSIS